MTSFEPIGLFLLYFGVALAFEARLHRALHGGDAAS